MQGQSAMTRSAEEILNCCTLCIFKSLMDRMNLLSFIVLACGSLLRHQLVSLVQTSFEENSLVLVVVQSAGRWLGLNTDYGEGN